jgi:hypothetical protein
VQVVKKQAGDNNLALRLFASREPIIDQRIYHVGCKFEFESERIQRNLNI